MTVQRRYLEMFVDEGAELLAGLRREILRVEAAPGDVNALQSALRLAHTLKGGAKMVGLDNVSRAAHAMESQLRAKSDTGGRAGADVRRVLTSVDRIRGVLALVAEGREGEALKADLAADDPLPGTALPVEATAAGSRFEATQGRPSTDRVRVSVERLGTLQNLADDLALQKAKVANHTAILRRAFRWLDRLGWEDTEGEFTRRENEILRRVVRRLGGRGIQGYLEDLDLLERMVGDVHELVLELRLVRLAEILDGHHRTVRRLAQELGKSVTLTIEGRLTEVDSRLLEPIQACLTHLLRNAVDHGIETAAERRAAGKHSSGEVTIRAYQKSGAVVIEVEDDGRGLDSQQIRATAERKGFVGARRGQTMTDQEVYHLLCEPGFTTRTTVTEVSGRGVGLDVVQVQLETLNGSLAIQSEMGVYTRFRLSLPIAVSAFPALIVRVGTMQCAVPSLFVRQTVRVERELLDGSGGTILHERRALRVVSMARLFGEPAAEPPRRVAVVVLQVRGRDMALQVDALVEERRVIPKSLGEHPKGAPFALGLSFVADEQPVPVLHVMDLHSRWHELEKNCGYSAQAEVKPARVLVVDDSAVARHLEQTVLEDLGFQVVQASDGEEAWKRLQGQRVDLVLTDVEMEGIDGLELTRRIRGNDRLNGVPVVLVSGRVSEEDREAGILAGADAYLQKDQLDHGELPATLNGLLSYRRSHGGTGRSTILADDTGEMTTTAIANQSAADGA